MTRSVLVALLSAAATFAFIQYARGPMGDGKLFIVLFIWGSWWFIGGCGFVFWAIEKGWTVYNGESQQAI